ncbi:P-loop containing nucleoside triphosphate hydrolase protein [Scleroderma yunnanense]
MSSGEQVIAVMGPTGVGKSSFIHDSVPPGSSTEVKVGHGLQSETSEVQPICWATEDGTTVKLADTPGFDDSRLGITDTDVLKMISTFLVNEYKEQRSQLTGLIYVHRISDTRVGGTSKRNLRMFRKLCGDDSLKNVVIVTTMWDKVTEAEGIRREQELKSSSDLFKPLVDEGAVMMRHDRTPQSAAHVIKYLLGKSATTTQIVRELAEERKALENTAAEMESLKVELESLKAEIHQMRRGPTEERRKTKQEMEINEVAEERQQMARMMGKLSKELDDLKRGIQFDPPPVYEPTNNFPAPDTKCIVNCSKLLQLVKKYESTLPPDIATSITSCTLAFADAVERSVKGIQRGSSALKSALASEDMHTLQLLMKADPYPRAFTHGTWVTARRNMEIVTSDIEVILSTYPRQRGSDPLNAILECTMEVVTGMAAMVDWWKPVTDAIGNLEDAAHHRRGGSSFANSTNTVALTRITRALDAYCKAYSECQQTVHEAALGISLK